MSSGHGGGQGLFDAFGAFQAFLVLDDPGSAGTGIGSCLDCVSSWAWWTF